ncbi:MAG: hypothetical protein WD078_15700 [Woeseia sp.]
MKPIDKAIFGMVSEQVSQRKRQQQHPLATRRQRGHILLDNCLQAVDSTVGASGRRPLCGSQLLKFCFSSAVLAAKYYADAVLDLYFVGHAG